MLARRGEPRGIRSGRHGVAGSEPGCCHFLRIPWETLAALCQEVASQVHREYRPEVVVGLARAGYVPAAIVASLLRRDLVTLRVPSRGLDAGPGITPETLTSLTPLVFDRRALVVDETNGSGDQLITAARMLRLAGASDVRTLTLFLQRSGHHPDYFGVEGEGHVLQPWVAQVILD
ncbi:MAG: hypothetical protein HY660_14940 [Armatimonadetes bacterium]|nr:hypothetical protein [Armatimonadota bacterium]